MDNIIDLTAADADHEILTQTSSSGFLGGQILNERSLSAYLREVEEPKQVVRNKKSGVEIEQDGETETIKPDEDYQALAVVTDLRVLSVVGKETGNETRSLPMDEIFDARTTSGGLRVTVLEIETFEGDVWRFPCRSDPETVAATVDILAHAWVSSDRLLAESEESLEDAAAALPNDEAAAREHLTAAESSLQTASQRIPEAGPTAEQRLGGRATELAEMLQKLRRFLRAEEGASAHARAQEAWEQTEYEAAARSYEATIEAYEDALDGPGSRPTDEQLRRRLDGVETEQDLLRVWPLVESDANRRQAIESTDPEKAAIHWKRALDGYRGMLSLEWESEDREFSVDEDRVRDQAREVADDAIEDYYEAARQRLSAGDAETGEEAETKYRQAKELFEQARQIAEGAKPAYLEPIETALFTAERRVEGHVPAEPEQPVVPALTETSEPTGSEEVTPVRPAEETESESVIDQIKSQKQASGGTGSAEHTSTQPGHHARSGDQGGRSRAETATNQPPAQSDDHAQATTETGDPTGGNHPGERTASPAGEQTGEGTAGDEQAPTQESEEAAGGETTYQQTIPTEATPADEPEDTETEDHEETDQPDKQEAETDEATDQHEDLTATEITELLRSLEETAFTEFVADVWEAEGWSTTVFSATPKAVYDIVAMQEGNEDERLLLWTVHRPDGGGLGTKVVKQCATARESSQGNDRATLVTTGGLAKSAKRQADQLDVNVVDCEDLVDRIESLELVGTLEATA